MEKLVLKIPKSLVILISLMSLTACSGGTTDSGNLDPYTVTAGALATADTNSVSGLGSIRFSTQLNGIYSNNSLALKAQLDQTGNSVTAVFNSNNSLINSTTGGVAVTFTRSGASVTASVTVGGSSVSINSSQLLYYVPSSLDVIIDVHNVSSTRTHVLIWRRDLTVYSATNADVDTDQAGDLLGSYPTGSGAGDYAGLILNNATVTGAHISIAKVAE